jgi:uncharacterized Zn-finger protein
MAEPITPANKPDVTKTGQLRVQCGGPAWGRHPKVFLSLVDDAKGQPSHVVCPYCSHTFVYEAKLASHTAAH